MSQGEEKVWDLLKDRNADELCREMGVSFDSSSGLYTLRSFGRDFYVSPQRKEIVSRSPGDEPLLGKLGFFFRLSVLGYLALGKDVALTGRLINPTNMKSGQLFFRGSHVLPLDKVADKYGNDREAFLRKGKDLGAIMLEHGDASVKVYPLPGIPVVLILWLADEEFPPRADLLFDEACEMQLPIDVIWSIAMLTTLAML